MQFLTAPILCRLHGPSEIEKKFHGVKMMECWARSEALALSWNDGLKKTNRKPHILH